MLCSVATKYNIKYSLWKYQLIWWIITVFDFFLLLEFHEIRLQVSMISGFRLVNVLPSNYTKTFFKTCIFISLNIITNLFLLFVLHKGTPILFTIVSSMKKIKKIGCTFISFFVTVWWKEQVEISFTSQ